MARRKARLDLDGRHIVLLRKKEQLPIAEFVVPGAGEDWIRDLVAAITGLDRDGKAVSWKDRLQLRERLRALRPGEPGSPVKDPEWARLLKWWLIPESERPREP
jgi:hypothetical protein